MAHERTTHRNDDGSPRGRASEHDVVWVSLQDPSLEELATLRHEYALPELLSHESATEVKRPSLEVVGQVLVAVIKTARWAADQEAIGYGTIQLAFGDSFVISVEHDTNVYQHVRQELQADPGLSSFGPAAALPCVVVKAVDGYGSVLAAINEVVEEVEDAVFDPGLPRSTARIYHLSRQVLQLRRVMGALVEMLDRLAAESRHDHETLKRRFREQRAHLKHLIDTANGLGSLLSNMLQAQLTEVSVRQNDDMRRISAWVAIWAVPTLLAGIYGMNFRHMPELDWPFGYPLVLVAMLVICVVLYRGFRRTGWL